MTHQAFGVLWNRPKSVSSIGDAASMRSVPQSSGNQAFGMNDSFDGEHGQEWFLSLKETQVNPCRHSSKRIEHNPQRARFPRR